MNKLFLFAYIFILTVQLTSNKKSTATIHSAHPKATDLAVYTNPSEVFPRTILTRLKGRLSFDIGHKTSRSNETVATVSGDDRF